MPGPLGPAPLQRGQVEPADPDPGYLRWIHNQNPSAQEHVTMSDIDPNVIFNSLIVNGRFILSFVAGQTRGPSPAT